MSAVWPAPKLSNSDQLVLACIKSSLKYRIQYLMIHNKSSSTTTVYLKTISFRSEEILPISESIDDIVIWHSLVSFRRRHSYVIDHKIHPRLSNISDKTCSSFLKLNLEIKWPKAMACPSAW